MRTMVEEEERVVTGAAADTEITLGMKSLLGVFFGSVLICGVFFGFGYSLGRGNAHPGATSAVPSPAVAVKSAPSDVTETASAVGATPPSPASVSQSAASGSDVQTIVSDSQGSQSSASGSTDGKQTNAAGRAGGESAAKISAGQLQASQPQYEYVPTPEGPARRPAGAPEKNSPDRSPRRNAVAAPALDAVTPPAMTKPSAAIVRQTPPLTPLPVVDPRPQAVSTSTTKMPAASPATLTTALAASAAPAGATMVQIAAVSHQEDAGILVSALRRRGYEVVVRNDPKDALFHVQIGPFPSRDQAKAMRARLLGDGYNAILK